MLKILKYSLLLLIIIGATAGGTALVMSRAQPSPQNAGAATPAQAGTALAPAPAKAPKPLFLGLDPFTVTLYGPGRNHILYTEITLRLGNPDAEDLIRTYMPEFRDRVIGVLSEETLDHLRQTDGREELTDTLKKKLSEPVAEDTPGAEISDVLFTAFVVQ